MNLALAIKKARQLRGYSQEELGKLVGLTQGAVGHFENGRRSPSVATLEKIALACQVSLVEIMNMGDEALDNPQPAPQTDLEVPA